MNTVLVTGANGFVGRAMALRLIARGWKVRLFDLPNNPYWSEWDGHNVERSMGDLRNETSVAKAVQGCTHVLHTAALLNSVAPPAMFEAINVMGTQHLLSAATQAGVAHFVYVSTSDVFGLPSPSGDIFDETSPHSRWNEPYADTKIRATALVKAAHATHGLATSVVYPGWVYGPGDRQFFPALMDMVRGGIGFTWHRGTPYDINLIHIADLCDGIERIIDEPIARGEDYLLLDVDTGYTPRALLEDIALHMGASIRTVHVPYPLMLLIGRLSQWAVRRRIVAKPLLSTTDVKAFGHAFRFSNAKAARHLGWQPRIAPREGVATAVACLASDGPARSTASC